MMRPGDIHNQGAIIGQQQVGTVNSEQRGDVCIQAINHTRANELQEAIMQYRDALARDKNLDEDQKVDAEHTLTVIEGELVKPVDQQDKGKLMRRVDQLASLSSGGVALIDLVDAIRKLLMGG